MKLGVVGLPNVGKSTLFNAITNGGRGSGELSVLHHRAEHGRGGRAGRAAGRSLPRCIIRRRRPRRSSSLSISRVWSRARATARDWATSSSPTSASAKPSCMSCAALKIRTSFVTRTALNPQRDIETINLELIAADRETVAKRAERAVKMLKSGEKQLCRRSCAG